MNERIRELLNEATSGHEQEHDRSKVMTVSDKEMEKFAQLIVKECALTAGLMEHEGRKNIGAQILNNFGVEK
jgi:coenzyme F420-reducing hydrogenase delta subunit